MRVETEEDALHWLVENRHSYYIVEIFIPINVAVDKR